LSYQNDGFYKQFNEYLQKSQPVNSYGEFNKAGAIKRLLGFHHFKPSFNGFLYIFERFFTGLSLRQASRKRWNLRNIIAGLIFFNDDVQLHKNLQILFTIKHVFRQNLLAIEDMFLFTLRLTPHVLRSRYSLCALRDCVSHD